MEVNVEEMVDETIPLSDSSESSDFSGMIANFDRILHSDKERGIDDTVKLYLKEIGNMGLLNKAEEYEVSKKMDEGDEMAKQRLVLANLRLVVSIAKK